MEIGNPAKFCDFTDIRKLQKLIFFFLRKKKIRQFYYNNKEKKKFLNDLSKLKTPPFRTHFLAKGQKAPSRLGAVFISPTVISK